MVVFISLLKVIKKSLDCIPRVGELKYTTIKFFKKKIT
jgi:hypothetical protein